ncbi:hypothetical protein HDV63DRAFT_384728 [Trichoderma sp. SZMC 28014]
MVNDDWPNTKPNTQDFPLEENADTEQGKDKFRFITFQDPNTVKLKSIQRVIRSHGAKKSLEGRKKKLKEVTGNFRHFKTDRLQHTSASKQGNDAKSSIDIQSCGSTQSLAISNSARLQSLIGNKTASQALEPVCNFSEATAHQKFNKIFHDGFNDEALSNAIMLSLTFAANEYHFTQDCATFKNTTIRHINHKISSSLDPPAVSQMIGAILLLIGVEWRLGNKPRVEMHLAGVMQLLNFCDSKLIHLHDGIKRAIFWQDLNSAWIIGSERRFAHDSFPELHWSRNPFLSSVYMLPPGFEPLRHEFGSDLIKVVQDIYALQHYRESSIVDLDDPTSLLHLDNHQASIESRLYSHFLTTDESSGVLAGCILALYLCTYMLFSEVWAGHFIPSHMSAKLLRVLRDTKKSNSWEINRDAMLWCTIVGGTFAQLGVTRSEYILLLHQSGYGTLPSAWKETESFLEKFLWSKKVFYGPGKALWDAYSLN